MTSGQDHIKEVVDEALDLEGPARDEYLAQVFQEHPRLVEPVRRLLAQSAGLDSFLATPCTLELGQRPSDLAENEVVGRYRIVRRIASGGAGTVYEAQQEKPHRTVALKLLHASLGSSAARRFVRESELLAGLEHPGIAHVYEAGVHGDGALQIPYIAMELVRGAQTVVAYASSQDLDLGARLELFIAVCQAVQHGHDRAVVHRDLKPQNILVGTDGRPKVIDFGVARVLDAPSTASHTQVGDLVGTLPYMSPEQCAGDPDSVDPRTDVYGLGVVLFELLSGRLPLGVVGMPIEEAIRAIRLQPPNSLRGVVPELAQDLDAIVSMALRKERDQRYGCASELAADLERFLEGRPVVAQPPSVAYRARLFARRHRYMVSATAAVFLILVAAVVVTLSFALHSQQLAESESRQRRIAELTGDYLESLLKSPNPHDAGESVTVLQLLDGIDTYFEANPVEFPEVEIRVRTAVGETYLALGRYDAARVQLDRAATLCRATAPRGVEMVSVLSNLGILHGLRNEHREAELAYREVLEVLAVSEESDSDIARTLGNLADSLMGQGKLDEAFEAARDTVVQMRELESAQGLELAGNLRRLARIEAQRGNHNQHDAHVEEALVHAGVSEDHPFVSSSLMSLGRSKLARGDDQGSYEAFARAWEITSRHRAPGSRDWNLAFRARLDSLVARDERTAVLTLVEEGIGALERELGTDDYRTREARSLLKHFNERWSDNPGS